MTHRHLGGRANSATCWRWTVIAWELHFRFLDPCGGAGGRIANESPLISYGHNRATGKVFSRA